MTNFSILCIGWMLELIMFMIALCLKTKHEHNDRLNIIKENMAIENKLLIQKQERQNAIHQSRYSERLKISVDIHDGISNAITGLKFYINDRKLQAEDDNEKKLLSVLENEVNSIYIQVRNYIQELYSGENETYNINFLLNNLPLQYKNAPLQFLISVDDENNFKKLSKFQIKEFYFIISEIVSNAVKHSQGNKNYDLI